MKKLISKVKLNIFQGLITLLAILSLIPITILIAEFIWNLDSIKSLSKEVSERIVKEQTAQLYKTDAEALAQRISDFLESRTLDLESLSNMPRTEESFLQFYRTHNRWLNSVNSYFPLYKEIAYIDKNGMEKIRIINGSIMRPNQLKNISNPENTTYRSETYFADTKKCLDDIYVAHLTGWYISRYEQLEQGKTYDGVIRFCRKIKNSTGDFDGIFMIALDHKHLIDFILPRSTREGSLLDGYKHGNYTYIFDDEGWIIAHPKLWDIKGVDKNGHPIEPYTKETESWMVKAGMIPVNLFNMDWRLYDIYTGEPISNIIKRVRRGESVLATFRSLGISGGTEGVIRTRVYAPIHFELGTYNKYAIFGGVLVGTSLEDFLDKTRILTSEIETAGFYTKRRMISIAILIFIAAVILSFFIARKIARSMRKINDALIQIGDGNYGALKENDISNPVEEITALSHGVIQLSNQLDEKDRKIHRSIKDLEIVNTKLAAAQNELDSYWKQEYETESDNILEEKIKFYEDEYPNLVEIRKNICIGNSPQFLRVLRQIVPLSQMTLPAWIYGESGVGKSALARVMHLLSPRREKSFFVFEASEFSAADSLIILGKLFGYGVGHGIRGIDKNGQKGIIEECEGGTLLIDDVDALSLETQAKLLRVVDGLHFHPAVGKIRNIIPDIRFIFATNKDLEQLVQEGLFRKDLFRRMGGSINKIEIPPLRKRTGDIPILAKYFVASYCQRNNVELKITNEAVNLLNKGDYSEGNIGELKMMIELACEKARIESESIISDEHFQGITRTKVSVSKKESTEKSIFTEKELKELNVLRKNHFRMEVSEEELGYTSGSRTLSHHLRGMCYKALYHSKWDIGLASRIITDSHQEKYSSTIERRIKRYVKNIYEKGNSNNGGSLFKNLPKEYHHILDKSRKYFRSKQ